MSTETPTDGPSAWLVSARSAAALRGQARRLFEFATSAPEVPAADIGRALATSRSLFKHRAVVFGADRAGLLANLGQYVEADGAVTDVIEGIARDKVKLAFLCTGQGGQRPGMGRELCQRFAVFATAFDEACAAVDPHLDRPIRELMWAEPGSAEAELLNQTRYTQPALFVYQVAAIRLLDSLGVRPDALAGHSVGEYAAAHAAGVWSLADAGRLIATRARLMHELRAPGAMVAIEASAAEVQPMLTGQEWLVGLAAINSPTSVVVSGDEQTCLAIGEHWRELGRRTRRLPVSHAFHSPLMEPMIEQFAAELATVELHQPALTTVSNLTGDDDELDWADPRYWVAQIRRAVRFADTVAGLESHGVTGYLEIGPDAVLSGLVHGCLADAGSERRAPTVVPLGRAKRAELEALHGCLAQLSVAGVPVDWAALFGTGHRTGGTSAPTCRCTPSTSSGTGWKTRHLVPTSPRPACVRWSTSCWTRRSRWATAARWCSPAGSPWRRCRGWPTTRWPARWWCPARRCWTCCWRSPANSTATGWRS